MKQSDKDSIEILPADQIISNLVMKGDLSGLTPDQKVRYYNAICYRLGLDPLTQPFKLLQLSGKEVLYCDRSGAQQLNNLHKVSHRIMAREVLQGCYIVSTQAFLPNGRQTESIGAVPISNLKGESLCNAFMKAETKSKRRSTLDLLGLGMLDETEVSSIPDAALLPAPVNHAPVESHDVAQALSDDPEKQPEPQKEDPVVSLVISAEQKEKIQSLLENPIFNDEEREKGYAFLAGNPLRERAVKFIARLNDLIFERSQKKSADPRHPQIGIRLAYNAPPEDHDKGPMTEDQKKQINALVKKYRVKKADKEALFLFSRCGTGYANDQVYKEKETAWADFFITNFETIYQNFQDEMVRLNVAKESQNDTLNRLLGYYEVPEQVRAAFFEFALNHTDMEHGPEFKQLLIENFTEFLEAFQNKQ